MKIHSISNPVQLKVTQLNPIKTKSEEEAWLDAIESGDLEQVRNKTN